jgi:putative ABC transport system ATP-binding protein
VSAATLEFDGVSKRYRDGARGEIIAVDDVSFTVAEGEWVLLRGASGAGKSTLVGLASGIVLPTRGEVRFRSEPFSRLREWFRASLRRESMGVVLQGLALVPGMSVIENVLLADVPAGTVGRARIARAEIALERWRIAELARSNVDRLSGGERQRVALARAFVSEPTLVVLDEPTAHLDPTHVETLVSMLAGVLDRGGLALVATHDPRLGASDRITRALDVVGGRIKS